MALMGRAGGKSTLMKILTGIYSKDEGTIHFEGKEVEYKNVSESEADRNRYCSSGIKYDE